MQEFHALHRFISKGVDDMRRFLGIFMLLWTLIDWALGQTVSGWASLMCSIWMIGGIQLLSLGLIGEYIGKIYNETKQRPRFIIERVLNKEN